jgi:pyrimidine-nucleoside phosphorylase
MGKRIVALITAMDEPLGREVGNFLEIEESMDVLEGKARASRRPYPCQGAWMTVLAGKAAGFDEGRALCEGAIRSGGRSSSSSRTSASKAAT